MEKKCANPVCNSTELVYSGVDAMLLGVPTEKWCYTCANAVALAHQELVSPN